ASLLCDRNEIAQVPQLHSSFHISKACPSAYKVFFPGARGAYLCFNGRGPADSTVPPAVQPAAPCAPHSGAATKGLHNHPRPRGHFMSRTIKFAKAGGPEVLEFLETEVPTPGPTEVRIKVKAIGINRAESMWRAD